MLKRNRIKILFFILLYSLPIHAGQVGTLVLKDATGRPIPVGKKPERIITLAPSLAEITAEILPESDWGKIRLVTDFTDFPEALKSRSSVGSYARFSIEKIIQAKPDLVIATLDGNPKDQIEHLRELGVNVVVVRSSRLMEMYESYRIIGIALGLDEKATKQALRLKENIESLSKSMQVKQKKTILLQVGDQPMVVAGGVSFLNDAIETIQAVNVYENLSQAYPRPNIEDVMKRNPDCIIYLALSKNDPVEKILNTWKKFEKMTAVKTGCVRSLSSDELLRPASRFAKGLELLAKTVYPEKQ